uniref:Uncharacterized protein n=1 Tax=Oryza glumipatula TaxID=40148 RepID=A0A0D9ZIW0_9ORYZ
MVDSVYVDSADAYGHVVIQGNDVALTGMDLGSATQRRRKSSHGSMGTLRHNSVDSVVLQRRRTEAPASCGVGRRRQRRSRWHGDSGNRRKKGEEKGRRPAVFIEGEASVRAMHDANLRKDDTGSRCAACGSSVAALPQRRAWADSVPINGSMQDGMASEHEGGFLVHKCKLGWRAEHEGCSLVHKFE